MQKQTLAAIVLSLLLGVAYLASLSVNTNVITRLATGGFAFFYVLIALLGGFIAYSFGSLIANRLVRRLVFVASFALALFAGGSAYRAITIQRLFAQNVTQHDDALSISFLKSGSAGLQSPYTQTVFYLPTTIVPDSQFAGLAYVGRCARVKIEETAGGDKRIVMGGAPLSEAGIVTCPSR